MGFLGGDQALPLVVSETLLAAAGFDYTAVSGWVVLPDTAMFTCGTTARIPNEQGKRR